MNKTAKLFSNGGSQAVRLPAEFRFAGEEVFVWRDERTGDIILSARPPRRWEDFARVRDQLRAVPEDFMSDRQQSTESRDAFASER